ISRRLAKRRLLARWFCCAREFADKVTWGKRLKKAIDSDPKHQGLTQQADEHPQEEMSKGALDSVPKRDALAQHPDEQPQDDMMKDLSAGLFFRTAEKEHMEWLIQHHSMYHLSANFVVLLIVCAIWSLLKGWFFVAGGSILGAYLLTTFALDNYLYTYELSFRNAYLALKDACDPAQAPEGTEVLRTTGR
ncbi:MAG: hypothetical protein ACRD3J_18155, partial [Thermoanaerobaculia bacterium]